MLALLWEISLKRSGLERFYVETVGFSQKKSQKMSGDFVAQWVSLIWAALDGHHELNFCVLSCLEVRGWAWGQCLWGCHKCGIMAASVGLTASRSVLHPLCWGVTPSPLCQCRCSHSSGLSWLREPNQRSARCIFGWATWLALDLFELPLGKCLCCRWPGREGWRDQPLVVVGCFQNHALIEKATKGSVFKKCLSLSVYCVYF